MPLTEVRIIAEGDPNADEKTNSKDQFVERSYRSFCCVDSDSLLAYQLWQIS